MGLWDKIRSRRDDDGDGTAADTVEQDGPGADWFRPTLGGTYTGPDGEQLVFGSQQVVLKRTGRPDLAGEYTTSGRFTTVATFERPVVFTVADPVAGDPPLTESFVARRTDTADASSNEIRYTATPPAAG